MLLAELQEAVQDSFGARPAARSRRSTMCADDAVEREGVGLGVVIAAGKIPEHAVKELLGKLLLLGATQAV